MPRKGPPPRDWTPAMSGAAMRERREAAGLSRKQVAEAMDVHPNTIARWENEDLTISKPIARLFMLICELAEKPSHSP